MKYVRPLVFYVLFYVGSVLLFATCSPGLLLPRKRFLWFTKLWTGWVIFLAKYVLGITYRVRGLENIPKGRFMVAALHQSAYDIFALAHIFPHPAYVAKQELFRIPLFGAYMKHLGLIPVNRKAGLSALKNLIQQAKQNITPEQPLIIYPEGTRATPGSILPFQSGIGVLYEALNLPVLPVVLDTGYYWPRKRIDKKAGCADICILPPIMPGLSRLEFMGHLQDVMHKEWNSREDIKTNEV